MSIRKTISEIFLDSFKYSSINSPTLTCSAFDILLKP